MTHAGLHRWTPDVAPDYRCVLPGPDGAPCDAVGRRATGVSARRDAAIRQVATVEDRQREDEHRQDVAEADLERRERRAPRYERETTAAVDTLPGMRPARRDEILTSRHTWTEADEDLLREAVAVVWADEGGVADDAGGAHGRVQRWHAVAGRLLPGLRVSPDACRTRWGVVEERERRARLAAEAVQLEAEARAEELQAAAETPQGIGVVETRAVVEPDAWEALSRRIAAWEAESADELTVALCGLRADVREVDLRVRGIEERVTTAMEEIRRGVAGLLAEWKG